MIVLCDFSPLPLALQQMWQPDLESVWFRAQGSGWPGSEGP